MLADFIGEGHFARHLRRMRLLYADRRAELVSALRKELPALEPLGDAAGLHLVLSLPSSPPDRETALRAASHGLWTLPLSACFLGPVRRQGLVLGYGAVPAREIRDAVRRLKSIL